MADKFTVLDKMLLLSHEHAGPAIKLQWQLSLTRIERWVNNDVFRFNWWLLLAMFLFSVTVWWKTVKKPRLREISMYVLFIIILTLVLDEIGEEFTLWDYPYDLFPLFPPLSAIDLACLPFIYSLIYQRFGTWKSFIIATVIMSGIFCFILEPIFVRIGIYQMLTWKSYYGFPIYALMGIVSKAAVKRVCMISPQ